MKDDSVYLWNDAEYILQGNPLETFMVDYNKMNETFEKVMSLTTELLGGGYWKDEENNWK